MKKIAILFICQLLMVPLFSQSYKVIKVNGIIMHEKSKTALKTGIKLNKSDALQFQTANARAAVYGSAGRFVIMPDNKNLAYAKANFTPAMSNIASRGGAMINLQDLEKEFSGTYAIIDRVTLKINKETFPMDEEHFFYLRFTYNNEVINKKLSFSNDTLFINKNEILTIDGKAISSMYIEDMEILYMKDLKKGERIVINSFNPIFISEEDFKQEVIVMLEEMKEAEEKAKVDEILSYINDFYGKPNKENVKEWLKAVGLI